MVSTGKDLEEVCFGKSGVAAGGKGKAPKVIVDCSSISVQESADCRAKLQALGVDFLAAPVSGNGKVVKAGKLSAVASGPKAAFEMAKPYMLSFAPRGVSYVGEGELSRICKIAHNVMLGVVIQNLAEITILAEKAGVPRHAFLEFMNNGAMGSMFTRYKSNALRQSRLDHDVHARAAAQGPRPRAGGGPQARRADAGDGGDARGAAGALRRGARCSRTRRRIWRRISRPRWRRWPSPPGIKLKSRERARADGARDGGVIGCINLHPSSRRRRAGARCRRAGNRSKRRSRVRSRIVSPAPRLPG